MKLLYTLLACFLLSFSQVEWVALASDSEHLQGLPPGIHSSALHPVTELNIINKLIAPDGFLRSATLVNGTFPAPLLKAQKNDNFNIRVVNQLQDTSMPLSTSIHWHGIRQLKTNWNDGVAFVTQCPIPQNGSFLYQFKAHNQTGTYWYHSHLSTQQCDGLRGPLVIYDPEDPHRDLYDVDDESTVITLSDWYHDPSPQLNKIIGRAVFPNSILINGLGRYPSGAMTPFAVIDVVQGKRYRFRVIGLSCHASFNFTIDGHIMTIIEADGVETVPVTVDSLPVHAGQRYSVVVHANQPIDNYWIRVIPQVASVTFSFTSSAILRYSNAPDEDPKSSGGPSIIPFNEAKLASLQGIPAPGFPQVGRADVNLNLVAGALNGIFSVNNVTYHEPPIPVLLQMLSGVRHPSDILPKGSVYELPQNKVVEITLPEAGVAPGGPHPIHLHGQNFAVIRAAGNSTANFVNPIWRDTVSMGYLGDNVTIRFVTDNPGPWFLHCHIDFHLNLGFGAVMAAAPSEISEVAAGIPAAWTELCYNETSTASTPT